MASAAQKAHTRFDRLETLIPSAVWSLLGRESSPLDSFWRDTVEQDIWLIPRELKGWACPRQLRVAFLIEDDEHASLALDMPADDPYLRFDDDG
jgi:hypothetical protein